MYVYVCVSEGLNEINEWIKRMRIWDGIEWKEQNRIVCSCLMVPHMIPPIVDVRNRDPPTIHIRIKKRSQNCNQFPSQIRTTIKQTINQFFKKFQSATTIKHWNEENPNHFFVAVDVKRFVLTSIPSRKGETFSFDSTIPTITCARLLNILTKSKAQQHSLDTMKVKVRVCVNMCEWVSEWVRNRERKRERTYGWHNPFLCFIIDSAFPIIDQTNN
jgi:hypothetical protein